MPQKEQETQFKQEEEKELFTWKAPARPFKKRDKEFFTTIIAIGFLMSLILFFIDGFLPVMVIVALVFLVYVLSTVPPDEVEHKITTRGIYFAGKINPWFELTRFWFTHRFGSELLILESFRMPGRMEFVINNEDNETIKKHLMDYVLYEEAAPNILDKAAAWLGKRVNLDTNKKVIQNPKDVEKSEQLNETST